MPFLSCARNSNFPARFRMDVRFLFFLLVLGTSWCCNARMVTTNLSPAQNEIGSVLRQINHQQQEREVEAVEEFGRNDQLCSLCVKISTPVLAYLSNKSNQETITSTLGKICSYTLSLKDKCTHAVDYYLPLVFVQVKLWTPKTFCMQIGLCKLIDFILQHPSENSCESCHDAVAEVLLKLKDPDTRLEIIDRFLKACDAAEDSVKNCKGLVSDYAGLFLIYAQQFLKSHDICAMTEVCISETNATEQATISQTSMLSESWMEAFEDDFGNTISPDD